MNRPGWRRWEAARDLRRVNAHPPAHAAGGSFKPPLGDPHDPTCADRLAANRPLGLFRRDPKAGAQVKSGDIVKIDTVTGAKEHLPTDPRFHVPPAVRAIHETLPAGPGPHILTGPVYVEGAKPGMVLEVRILDVAFFQDWGFQLIIPLLGTLPHDFGHYKYSLIPIDIEAKFATLPWGLKLPVKPFFGVMGVAPPPGWGKVSTAAPQSFGGNLDNKELVAGTTLYLPIFNEGGFFSCGDGHGAQGDGEVCITAIETGLTGTFQFIVRDDLNFTYPRAETPTHYITMGMDPVSTNARKRAARHDHADRRGARPLARGRLYAVQPRRRSACHADRQRLEGHPCDAGEVADRAAGLSLLHQSMESAPSRRPSPACWRSTDCRAARRSPVRRSSRTSAAPAARRRRGRRSDARSS